MQIKNIFSVLLLATAFSVGTANAMTERVEDDAVLNEAIPGLGNDDQSGHRGSEDLSDGSGSEQSEEEVVIQNATGAGVTSDTVVHVDTPKPAATIAPAPAPAAKTGCCMSRCPLFSNWKRTAGSLGFAALIGAICWKLNKNKKNGQKFNIPA